MFKQMYEHIHNMKENWQPFLKLQQNSAGKKKKLVKRVKFKDWTLEVKV